MEKHRANEEIIYVDVAGQKPRFRVKIEKPISDQQSHSRDRKRGRQYRPVERDACYDQPRQNKIAIKLGRQRPEICVDDSIGAKGYAGKMHLYDAENVPEVDEETFRREILTQRQRGKHRADEDRGQCHFDTQGGKYPEEPQRQKWQHALCAERAPGHQKTAQSKEHGHVRNRDRAHPWDALLGALVSDGSQTDILSLRVTDQPHEYFDSRRNYASRSTGRGTMTDQDSDGQSKTKQIKPRANIVVAFQDSAECLAQVHCPIAKMMLIV